MDYRIEPFGKVWSDGIFNVPVSLADKYLKMASEYQLKAILYILRNGGQADSSSIAKALGQTSCDIDDLLEFWVDEGVLCIDGQLQLKKEPVKEVVTVKEVLPAPTLSPKDIVEAIRNSEEIAFLLNEAQVILGRTIGTKDQELLINMVNYYGLKIEVVMMILQFYRSETDKGINISRAYLNKMAHNWSEDGVNTISDAEVKLAEIEKSNRYCKEIHAITGLFPKGKQKSTVIGWFKDFDVTMITLANDIMKADINDSEKQITEPSIAYINSILKNWKKKNINTPKQLEDYNREIEKQVFQKNKKSGKLMQKPTYDLEKIKADAMNNTDF